MIKILAAVLGPPEQKEVTVMATMMDLVPGFGVSFRPTTRLFDRLFDEWFDPSVYAGQDGWVPAADIAETDKSFVVTAELPGVDPKNVDISYMDGVITIKGEKNKEMVEGESCHCSERYSGAFKRDFRIAGKIDKDNIDASFKDGVLKLTLPKSAESVPKRIEIH